MLIVFSGLPGSGKTTLSNTVARRLQTTYLRIDAIESAMWRGGIPDTEATGVAAYAVAYAVADAHLDLRSTVVIDAVNAVEEVRVGWRQLADRHGVQLRIVEVVCADRDEHRRRVERRLPEHDQSVNPTWADVLDREFEPWQDPRLVIDSGHAVDDCVSRIMAYLRTSPARLG